jgi:hypothetical protein
MTEVSISAVEVKEAGGEGVSGWGLPCSTGLFSSRAPLPCGARPVPVFSLDAGCRLAPAACAGQLAPSARARAAAYCGSGAAADCIRLHFTDLFFFIRTPHSIRGQCLCSTSQPCGCPRSSGHGSLLSGNGKDLAGGLSQDVAAVDLSAIRAQRPASGR